MTKFKLKVGHREVLMTSSLTPKELEKWRLYGEDYPLRELIVCEALSHMSTLLHKVSEVDAARYDNLIDFCQVLASCYKEITEIEEVNRSVVIHGVLCEGHTKDKVDAVISKAFEKSETCMDLLLLKRKGRRFDAFNSTLMIMPLLSNPIDTQHINNQIAELNRRIEEQKTKQSELEKREKVLKKKEEKGGSFKRSGHLTEQILKYDYPPDKASDLFSVLGLTTIEKLKALKVELSEIVEGIRLTASETKIIDCLCKLLHETSQTVEPRDSNYFTGNLPPSIIKYGEENTPAPKMTITLYELTQDYIGRGKRISGAHLENVSTVLYRLSQKNFLLRYKEETYQVGGAKTVKELEVFEKIIKLPTLRMSEYNKEGIEESKIEKMMIMLHPIFRRQIDTNYILYPNDINQRTIIAYGSNKISEATLKLRDYLMSSKKNNTYSVRINLDRLYYRLSEKYMKESRKAKVKRSTDKAIKTMINLGLLESYEIVVAKTTGEPQVVFIISRKFE